MVVGSIDGPLDNLGCVIQRFLLKFTDKRKLVTDGPMEQPTNGPTDTPSYRDSRMHLKMSIIR